MEGIGDWTGFWKQKPVNDGVLSGLHQQEDQQEAVVV